MDDLDGQSLGANCNDGTRHHRSMAGLCGGRVLPRVLFGSILGGALIAASPAAATCYSPVNCRCYFSPNALRTVCYNADRRVEPIPEEWRRRELRPWRDYIRPREPGWSPYDRPMR